MQSLASEDFQKSGSAVKISTTDKIAGSFIDEEGSSEENKEGTQRVFELNHRLTHSSNNNDDDQNRPSSSSLFGAPPSYDTTTSGEEVAVLLSGGVDSSVALKLLLLQGYKVSLSPPTNTHYNTS